MTPLPKHYFLHIGPLAVYRSDIHDYMERWIVRTPWFMVRLHHILRSDRGVDLHDHPFDFVSVILRGGYTEVHGGSCPGIASYRAGSVLFRRAEDLHRLVLDRPAWTVVFTGPVRRTWGFSTPTGWVDWREYDDSTTPGNFR
jgi:hypothetical protein